MLAAKNNHTDVLEMLIDQQADLRTTCNMSYVVILLQKLFCLWLSQLHVHKIVRKLSVCCGIPAWVAQLICAFIVPGWLLLQPSDRHLHI